MAYSVRLTYVPVFWVDQWSFLQELVGNHGHYSAALLWKPHGEHRILIPKLFLFGRFVLVSWQKYSADLHNFWFAAVPFGVPRRGIFPRIGELTGVALRTSAALACVCLFWLMQSETFWFASDLPIILPYVCATIAFGSVGYYLKADQPGGKGWRIQLLLSWVAALVASCSLSNGILLWPMLIVCMFAGRAPWRHIVATTAIGMSVLGMWVMGHEFPQAAHGSLSAWALISYLLAMYGSSWPGVNEVLVRIAAAMAIFMATALYVWLFFRKNRDWFALVMLSIAMFSLTSSVLAAVGRVSLGMGIEQARSGRYQTGVMIFWCSLVVLLIRFFGRMRRAAWGLVPIQILIAAIVSLGMALATPFLDGARIHARGLRAAATALEAGVDDKTAINYLFIPPNDDHDVLLLADFLRVHHWSVFKAEEHPLGRNLNRFYKLVPRAYCEGALSAIFGIPDYRWPGFRFNGWAYDVLHAQGPKAVILADPSGRIVGVGSMGFMTDQAPRASLKVYPPDLGYAGYVPEDLEPSQVYAYAILADGVSACPLLEDATSLDLSTAEYKGLKPNGFTRDLTLMPGNPIISIETLDGVSLQGKLEPIRIDLQSQHNLAGWMVDPEKRVGRAVDLVIDNVPVGAEYGYQRSGTSSDSRHPELRSGFLARFPKLTLGEHIISFRLVASSQDFYYQSGPVKILVKGGGAEDKR